MKSIADLILFIGGCIIVAIALPFVALGGLITIFLTRKSVQANLDRRILEEMDR